MSKERLTEKTKDCFGYRLKDGSDAEVGFFKDYDAFYSHMMTVKALGECEDLEDILREKLTDEAFGLITASKKDFSEWIDRILWTNRRCDELAREVEKYRELEEQGLLLRLPVAVGSKVYEIIEETVPEHYYYISECEVEDVSTKTVMYAGDWIDFNYPNLYFDRAEAEEKLRELEVER